MQWLKDVFGDVSTLFHFLLTEVRVKGTLPASVPPNALPKGKLINFCTGSHVHFDFDAATRTQLVCIGGRNPYEWVRLAAADAPLMSACAGYGAAGSWPPPPHSSSPPLPPSSAQARSGTSSF